MICYPAKSNWYIYNWIKHCVISTHINSTKESMNKYFLPVRHLLVIRHREKKLIIIIINSVQFTRSVVPDSLLLHVPQHNKPPCLSPIPRVHPNPCRWVGDAIQPSLPVLSPSPPALNLSQHQGLFKWVSSSHQVAKVLQFQPQHQSFQWTSRTDLL